MTDKPTKPALTNENNTIPSEASAKVSMESGTINTPTFSTVVVIKNATNTPTHNQNLNRIANPYSIKKEKQGTKERYTDINVLIRAISEYLDIIVRYNTSLKDDSWYTLWQSWIEEGILQNPSLHMVSVIIEFPPTETKSNKSIGEFMLQKFPILSRYITIPPRTRDYDPWLYLNKPILSTTPTLYDKIMMNTPQRKSESSKTNHNREDKNSPNKERQPNKKRQSTPIANKNSVSSDKKDAVKTPPSNVSEYNTSALKSPSKLSKHEISTSHESNISTTNRFSPLASDEDSIDIMEMEELEDDIVEDVSNPPLDIFYVEDIIDSRTHNGKQEYKIRWKGYGPADDTWEPTSNLTAVNVQILITKFENDRRSDKSTTDDIIADFASLTDALDNECDEINVILDKDGDVDDAPSKPTNMDTFWKREKEEFDNYIKEQHEGLAKKHKDLFLKQNELMELLVKEKESIKTLNSDTVETCMNLCTQFKDDLDAKSISVVNDVAKKAHEAGTQSITRKQEEWTNLEQQMQKNYAQLTKTNSIAIKNNKILTAKLEAAESRIIQMEETISIQKATIDGMSTTITSNDNRLTKLRDLKSSEYQSLVDTSAQKIISAAVKRECETICTKQEIITEIITEITTKCKSMEDNAVTKIEEIVKESTVLMASKINSAIDHKCKEAESKIMEMCEKQCSNENLSTPLHNRARVSNSLFPNVNPDDIPPPPQNNSMPHSDTNRQQYSAKVSNSLFSNVNPDDTPPSNLQNVQSRDEGIPQYHNVHIPYGDVNTRSYGTSGYNQANRSQFQLPLNDQEYIFNSKKYYVNTNTFYKLRWSSTCKNEMEILSFYKTLQHMASTCGIPLRDLDDVDEFNGVCPLTNENCTNYEKVYKLMSGAIFYKINDAALWTGYDQGWNLVKSNILNCDGFEVLYDVLAEVLPKLNKNTPKSHKIQRPTYTDIDNDNIYSYINSYNAFLEFESLGSNSRTYTPYEIAVYVADDLEKDPHRRFEKGIQHVRQKLERSPDGIIVPKDISISKIAKTICKYSPEYTVGEYKTDDTPVIHALKNNNNFKKYDNAKKPPKHASTKCSICGQLGHDTTTENGCMNLAKWVLCKQASEKLPENDLKSNTRKYVTFMRNKQSQAKQRNKIEKRIHSLIGEDESATNEALIHSLHILKEELFDDDSMCSNCSDEE